RLRAPFVTHWYLQLTNSSEFMSSEAHGSDPLAQNCSTNSNDCRSSHSSGSLHRSGIPLSTPLCHLHPFASAPSSLTIIPSPVSTTVSRRLQQSQSSPARCVCVCVCVCACACVCACVCGLRSNAN